MAIRVIARSKSTVQYFLMVLNGSKGGSKRQDFQTLLMAVLHLPLARLQTTTSICPRILPLMKKLDQNKTQSLSPTMKRPTLEHSKDRRPGDIVITPLTPVPDPCLYLLIDELPPPSMITFNNTDDPSMALDHLTNQMMKNQGQSGTLSMFQKTM